MDRTSGAVSKKEVRWRRSYKACLNCRLRKIKCDLGPLDNPHEPPCRRCKREGRSCEFIESKKRGTARERPYSTELKPEADAGRPQEMVSDNIVESNAFYNGDDRQRIGKGAKWKFEMSSMQNALEFLAKAAGSVAKEGDDPQGREPFGTAKEARDDVAWRDFTPPSFGETDEIVMTPSAEGEGTSRKTAHLIKKLSSVRPKSSIKLSSLEFVGAPGQLSEEEVIKLIDVFFLTMYPFFPHVPLQLQDPKELARYPLLLCSIVTVSARYHTFCEIGLKDNENGSRNLEVHEQLWVYCQRLISQTIWAEASTRSIGTVFAFLLFTEWNPRAIHWKWADYANSGSTEPLTSKSSERLTGMAAIRRSDRMAWMLTGNAVRLAQDMGFNEISSKVFVATHIAETHTATNVGQRSTLAESLNEINLDHSKAAPHRSKKCSNNQFYLEKILENDETKDRWSKFLHNIQGQHNVSNPEKGPLSDLEQEFLNDEYVLYYTSEGDTRHRSSSASPPSPLKFSMIQCAKIELLRLISVGFEAIYCDRDKQHLLINDPSRNLTLLHILSPLIESWYKNYRELLTPAKGEPCSVSHSHDKRLMHELVKNVEGESLICEYNFCQLYIYSSALQVDVREGQLKLHEITRSAKYVELAYNAAKELLNSAQRLQKLNMLRYMPVRWVTRIVKSVAFIVKCYLTLMGDAVVNSPLANTILKLTVIPSEDILHTIRTAAIILKESSPDELHLCTRYSTILMSLCSETENHSIPSPTPATAVRTRPDDQRNDLTIPLQPWETTIPLPSDVVDWFSTSDEIGLEFVEPWAEMIEQRYLQGSDQKGPQIRQEDPENSTESPTNESHESTNDPQFANG